MKAVIQRVTEGSLTINNQLRCSIGKGLVILLGIEEKDTIAELEWLSRKIINLRIFSDEQGLMNRSIADNGGDILLASQFTLHALVKKGNRPSFIKAARPEEAIPLYEHMISQLGADLGKSISTGQFGADMQISLINDGPVTIIIDTRDKE